MWPFKKPSVSPFLAKGRKVTSAGLGAMLEAAGGEEGSPPPISTADDGYWLMPEKELKAFIWKYHRLAGLPEYTPEVFDCEDFATSSRADIAKGQASENLPAPLPWGTAEIVKPNGDAHALNIAMTAEGKVLFYDPKIKTWYSSLPPGFAYVRDVQF